MFQRRNDMTYFQPLLTSRKDQLSFTVTADIAVRIDCYFYPSCLCLQHFEAIPRSLIFIAGMSILIIIIINAWRHAKEHARSEERADNFNHLDILLAMNIDHVARDKNMHVRIPQDTRTKISIYDQPPNLRGDKNIGTAHLSTATWHYSVFIFSSPYRCFRTVTNTSAIVNSEAVSVFQHYARWTKESDNFKTRLRAYNIQYLHKIWNISDKFNIDK